MALAPRWGTPLKWALLQQPSSMPLHPLWHPSRWALHCALYILLLCRLRSQQAGAVSIKSNLSCMLGIYAIVCSPPAIPPVHADSAPWYLSSASCAAVEPGTSMLPEECSETEWVQQRLYGQCCDAQACYGHTEGAAGLTGLLTATCSLQQSMCPGVMGLRTVNPYVGAALAEWRSGAPAGMKIPLVPKQAAQLAHAAADALAGDHLVLHQPKLRNCSAVRDKSSLRQCSRV